MKKIQAVKVRIAIFIILIVLAVILVVPAHNKLTSLADNFMNSISKQLEEQTGLVLSYSSLSPSILSTFSIQNINISDKNENLIISINKTRINYNLFELLKMNIQKGVRNITIDGISLDVGKLIEIINMLIDNQKKNQIDYKSLKTKIPELIKLKNISLKYSNLQLDSELLLKDVELNNNSKKQSLALNLDSAIYADLFNLNEKITASLCINGTILDDLDNSYIYFKFDNLTDGNYKLNKLNLMATYTNNRIDIQTIQAVNPISISAGYNLQNGIINALIKTEKLNPTAVVSSNQKNLNSLKNCLLDTNTDFYCDVKKKELNYSSNGQFYFSEIDKSDTLQMAYSFSGNEKQIDLQYLNVQGNNCSANMNLSYVYKTMQASGFAELPYFVLPNGNTVSTELYFDPLEKGFMVFSPQIFMGDKALTALQFSFMPQKDSYDFLFEAYDYTHSDSAEPGELKLDGSFLNNYIQGGVSINSFYLDSLIDFALQIVDKDVAEKISPAKNAVTDFMFSGDVYISTDFKSLSYNVPYLLLANTTKDNQFAMMSLNGNEQSIQLNQLSLILGKYALQASGSVDTNPDTKDMFFVADFNADSVPYHFSGSIMPEIVTITGDYGTDLEIRFKDNNALDGHAYVKDFPISFDGNSVIFSTESDFTYDLENGPFVAIKHFDAEGASAKFTVSPKLLMSGNITKYGAQIDSIAYTDFYSALEGTADVMVNVNDGVFDSVGLLMNVKNPLSDEAVAMDATISNPEHLKFDAVSLMDSLYINSQIQISNFSLNRFTQVKNDNNLLTASLFASGTLQHPYVALSMDNLSLIIAGNSLKTWGSVTLEDKLVSVNNFNLDFQNIKMDDLTATFSLETFEGFAKGSMDTDVSGKNIHMPLELKVSDTVLKSGKNLPESTVITLSSHGVDGSFVKKSFGFDLSALYSAGNVSLFSSDNLGLFGTVSSDGAVMINVNSKDCFSFSVSGITNKNETNVKIGDINADLEKIFSYFDMDESLIVENGKLEGAVSILNSFNDPVLKGALMVTEPAARLPTLIPQRIFAPKTLITVINNEVRVHDTEYYVKGSNSAFVGCVVYMNKWNIDHTEATVKTAGKGSVAVKMITPAISIAGDIICNLKIYLENMNMDVTGNIAGENVNITSDISSLSNSADVQQTQNLRTDLDIVFGNHAAASFDPVLRCVFVPNTHFNVKMDQEENLYEIDGQLKIKSGDIAYLNRSFYIKEGSIKFNRTEIANPLVTLSAETRERDENGQPVRILLSIDNQYLIGFEPKFSSIPAKSENEIRVLLGQIVVADSDTAANFLVAAGDYALQSALLRKAENKLREVLNFDIFSVRTNVIQNALILGTSNNTSKEITFGNLLDNSTVYVGKYLGSSLYLDAMLHVSFEDSFAKELVSSGNLLFQPEIGLEMESPYGNIRWNMAPDINALLNNQFVPSTSVTLSWKIAF